MIEPYVTRDDERGVWKLEREYVAESRGWRLVIPAGFETDLASIPRVLWNVIAPFDLTLSAPIVHDWLYRHGGNVVSRHDEGGDFNVWPAFTRADADSFLLDLMEQGHVAWWKRQAAYRAVRAFGGSSWQSTPAT